MVTIPGLQKNFGLPMLPMEPFGVLVRHICMSANETSGWTEEPESSTIETIADGIVDATGAFVRTFWYWSEDRPEIVSARARVASVTHNEDVELHRLRYWLAMDIDGKTSVYIGGHRIVVPTRYVDILPAQIAYLLNGGVGVMPGEQCS